MSMDTSDWDFSKSKDFRMKKCFQLFVCQSKLVTKAIDGFKWLGKMMLRMKIEKSFTTFVTYFLGSFWRFFGQ